MNEEIKNHIKNIEKFIEEEVNFANFMEDNDKTFSTELERAMYQSMGKSLSHNLIGIKEILKFWLKKEGIKDINKEINS